MRKLGRIVVHHSASPRIGVTAATIRGWHLQREFTDIGYHWVIEAGGKLVQGRPLDMFGAHCTADGANVDSIGVCVVGNNASNDESHHWDADQKQMLVEVVNALELLWGINLTYGHRDVLGAATLCPGLSVRKLLGRE